MIIVVGVPGSGKTSILREVQRNIPYARIVNFGDKMLKTAGIGDRDLLRKMPAAEQRSLGISAAKAILDEAEEITVVDTHAVVRTQFGYCPGLPKEVLEILSPRICAAVECEPSIILSRRSYDQSLRKRDCETEKEISIHQELTRSYLSACCMMTGALYCLINNSSDFIKENAAGLIHTIKSIKN